jgi:hypothetical protein
MDVKREHTWGDWDGGEEITHTEHKLLIVPGCCDKSKELMTVALRLVGEDAYYNKDEMPNVRPRWQLYSSWLKIMEPDKWFHIEGWRDVDFCPHCGVAMPLIRKRQIPLEPICDIIDGGYYCNTCHERLDACSCWPCEAHWEVVPVAVNSKE